MAANCILPSNGKTNFESYSIPVVVLDFVPYLYKNTLHYDNLDLVKGSYYLSAYLFYVQFRFLFFFRKPKIVSLNPKLV